MLNKANTILFAKNKPNLLRVAMEIATYENPHKVATSLLILIKGCTKDSGHRN